MGEYDKSLEFYINSLAIIEKELGKNHPIAATLYNNIGVAYSNNKYYNNILYACLYACTSSSHLPSLPALHIDDTRINLQLEEGRSVPSSRSPPVISVTGASPPHPDQGPAHTDSMPEVSSSDGQGSIDQAQDTER